MSRLEDLTLSQIKDLSPAERLDAINAIWDSMARDQPAVDLSDDERALLDAAARDVEERPESAVEWGAFRERLKSVL